MELHSLSFGSFKAITEGETYSIIMNLAKKSCALDPIPTTLLVKCIDVLLPVITKLVNISLESGHFPLAWKEALLRTILKKNGLDTVLKNYRPVSNLSFFSRVTKRAVFLQIDNHMKKHDVYPSLHWSAYRKDHSTETALLKVTNDILTEMNSPHVVLLVLLDLSAAFDTVDHSVLLRRLQTSFGISGAPLDWFKSYLSARRQRVSIPGALSGSLPLDWGVPQGSCLGPLLYIIYSSKLFNIIERHLPNSHCYAGVSLIYLSFKPDVKSTRCYNCHAKLHWRHSLMDVTRQTPSQWWKDGISRHWHSATVAHVMVCISIPSVRKNTIVVLGEQS